MEASIKALITGITGQDGSYLAELLLEKGYEVHGLKRRSSVFNTERIDHLDIKLHDGDITDSPSVMSVFLKVNPDEVYHLAAQSHVGVSFEEPEYTTQVNALGTLRILEAIRILDLKCSFYNAASSEMFGNSLPNQNEDTPMVPVSPYGISKLFALMTCRNYRDSNGIDISNGILFNHESPRRGATFVTKKITRGLSRIKLGIQKELRLGNLDARRDWGHARDYVRAMWLMLENEPGDFVISTGESHTVREFLDEAGDYLDIDWKKYVVIDPEYYRPIEINHLCGDSSKARKILGWEPTVTFRELVKEMCDYDFRVAGISH